MSESQVETKAHEQDSTVEPNTNRSDSPEEELGLIRLEDDEDLARTLAWLDDALEGSRNDDRTP